MTTPVFSLHKIDKRFPGVVALDQVDFSCHSGQVHALVGENGAGKSTLIKILAGAYQPDAGRIEVGGKPVQPRHPQQSLQLGISVIYQEFALLPERTVAENLFLGREPVRGWRLDRRRMSQETAQVLELFGDVHRIAPDRLIRDLDVAEQQLVEIAKAIALDARVIVMDEPTAALNEAECEVLYTLIGQLRGQGRAIVYITHRIREITRLADRVTVLKDGAVTATYDQVPPASDIIHAMVGRDIGDFYPAPAQAEEIGTVVARLENAGNQVVNDISIEFRAGEIVGFAGIQGAGRSALALAIFGEQPFERGNLTISGSVQNLQQPRDAIAAGVSMLPGDRKAEGLLLMQSVRDNGLLATRAQSRWSGSHKRNHHTDLSAMDALFDRLEVRATDYSQEVRLLSGGNQQKVIVARWLALKPKLLIFVEPTRGIDVNAKAGIYKLMRELARQGAAIMMVSSDLPEVLGASDRVIVMRDGTIAGEFQRGASEVDVMHLATGSNPTAQFAA